MSKLTAKQAKFCEEYMVDLNATQAAKRAGYSEKTAHVIGCENLTKPLVKKRISEMQDDYLSSGMVKIDPSVKNLLLDFFDGNVKDSISAIERTIINVLTSTESKINYLNIRGRYVAQETRYSILKAAGFKCMACGEMPKKDNDVSLEIDHILPISIGGTNDIDNLQVLCKTCNTSKGNRHAFNHWLDFMNEESNKK